MPIAKKSIPAACLIFLTLILTLALLPITHAQTDDPAPGQLAIVGADGNIHLYDVATDTLTQASTDGDNFTRRYDWPTWSTDGRLAYFGMSVAEGDAYSMGIFVRPANGGEAEKVYTSNRENFTYAYWSPADCPVGNCRDLAVLASPNGAFFTLKRVRVSDEATPEIDDLGEGAPFFWDWSPDGQSMLWARYSASLEVYDSAADEISVTYEEVQGRQSAIDWSPIDNRFLSAVLNEGQSDLVLFKGQTRTIIATDLRQGVAFEWSPDGTHIAYSDRSDGTLNVVEAATGKLIATPATETLAFFWSPDSSKIAYLTFGQLTESAPSAKPKFQDFALQWHVYDVATDSSISLAAFTPTQGMIYYLSFFDQFSRSHRLWSADSRYLTYGEVLSDGTTQVMLLDATTPGVSPQVIMEGEIGIFSWN